MSAPGVRIVTATLTGSCAGPRGSDLERLLGDEPVATGR